MSTDEYVCEVEYVNREAVEEVRRGMLSDGLTSRVADIFKILGDPTRVRILHALSLRELCVCDLSALLGMSQSAVSHQLRLLRSAGLVRYRREGKVVYYSLADEHIVKLLEMGVEHARE
ncbi:MAG: winged helix-turn-helix transcriptional regulator [Euryarchaeota archaeon]|nr:winged helix-turn-helix transcriptional regulator [Euryarchaeota archaeon]